MTSAMGISAPHYFLRQLEQLIGVHGDTIKRWVHQGTFPPPHRVGNRLAWSRDVIERHMAQQAEGATHAAS